MNEDSKTIRGYLPAGWEEAARSEGALQRSRKIKTAADLLDLNLFYLSEKGSFHNTAILMKYGTGIELDKEAVRKRIKGSWKWLRWMGHRLCLERGYAMEPPQWLVDRRVLLVDATDVALRGSETSDYRLHYMFNLFEYTCLQTELTTIAGGGERLDRYALSSGDIVIADRGYGTIRGMEHVRKAGAGFLLRLRTNAFTLYDEDRGKIELAARLRQLRAWEELSLDCFYKDERDHMHPVRIVATRKDDLSAQNTARKLSRIASRKQEGKPSASSQEMANYIVLATNLPDTTSQILALYRARWQIELVFRRLKGLFSFGEPPGTNPDSVKAWFYGKLLMAALCEAMTKQEPLFPPNADNLPI